MPKYESAIGNSRSIKALWCLLLALLAVSVYFLGLSAPFLGPDESRYAQVAREMMDRGDWITPTLGGTNWFEKPALLYWLEIASYKIFGVSEFAARFGSTLFGLGTVASLWILGRSVDPADGKDVSFGYCLSIMSASAVGIVAFSHGASFDIIITFPLTAALVSFFIWHSKNEAPLPRPRFSLSLFLFYFFVGVALLAKGLIGIVFPFAIVALFYLLSRRMPSRMFVISLFWGTLLALAIASMWYLPMYERHGWEFIDEFVIQHHFQRFTSNKYQHPQPFYFFLWVLPLMTLPWLPFFIASLWKNIRTLFLARVPGSPPSRVSSSPLLLFSTAWLIVPLVFFSFSGSKLPGYILPAVPAAMIFTATFAFDLVQKSKLWRNALLSIALFTCAAIMLLLVFAVPRFAEGDSIKTLIETANKRGYATNRVLTLHTISHNAEFYAPGRLLRDADGKQRRLSGVDEVLAEIAAENGRPVLVLVPLEYLSQLMRNEDARTDLITDNGELAITAVSAKQPD